MYDATGLYGFQFVDNVTLKARSGAAINVQTGVYAPAAQPTSAPTVRAAIAGQDGESESSWYNAFEGWNNVVTCKATGESVFYDPDQRALVLKQGHDQRVFVANLNATRYLGWSPDCRTIDGGVQEVSNANLPYDNAPLDDIYQDEASYSVTFWDAATGATLGAVLHPYRSESPARVDWSPGGERAFVRSTTGYFIFDPATQQQIPIHDDGELVLAVDSVDSINVIAADIRADQRDQGVSGAVQESNIRDSAFPVLDHHLGKAAGENGLFAGHGDRHDR